MGYLFLFIFSVWSLTVLSGSYSTNQLNGQHLRVIWVIYINLTKLLNFLLKFIDSISRVGVVTQKDCRGH